MVESKLVELVVAGSSPVGHPTFHFRLQNQLLCDFKGLQKNIVLPIVLPNAMPFKGGVAVYPHQLVAHAVIVDLIQSIIFRLFLESFCGRLGLWSCAGLMK